MDLDVPHCPQGATSSTGSLVASSCFCAFGYTAVAPQTSNSSLTCLLSFSATDSLSRFVDLGNPGESCDQVCAATGRKCQPELLDGLRDQSDVRQALTAVDVSVESAFSPSTSLTCSPVCTTTTRPQAGIQQLVRGKTFLVMLDTVSSSMKLSRKFFS